jgi:hypothetical protein
VRACLANTLSLVGGGIGLVARATGNDLDMTAAIPGLGDWRSCAVLSPAVEQRLLITHGHFRVMDVTLLIERRRVTQPMPCPQRMNLIHANVSC